MGEERTLPSKNKSRGNRQKEMVSFRGRWKNT